MTLSPTVSRKMRFFIHNVGLSCLGGAIFLQILVFATIAQNGYFMAIENNPMILALEVGLAAFALIYFVYIYQRLVRSER
jgi:hypothetical protein